MTAPRALPAGVCGGSTSRSTPHGRVEPFRIEPLRHAHHERPPRPGRAAATRVITARTTCDGAADTITSAPRTTRGDLAAGAQALGERCVGEKQVISGAHG